MKTIKVIEVIGTSTQSWEDAAGNAIQEATSTLSDISGLEVVGQTAVVKDGHIVEYRTNVKIAFTVLHGK